QESSQEFGALQEQNPEESEHRDDSQQWATVGILGSSDGGEEQHGQRIRDPFRRDDGACPVDRLTGGAADVDGLDHFADLAGCQRHRETAEKDAGAETGSNSDAENAKVHVPLEESPAIVPN